MPIDLLEERKEPVDLLADLKLPAPTSTQVKRTEAGPWMKKVQDFLAPTSRMISNIPKDVGNVYRGAAETAQALPGLIPTRENPNAGMNVVKGLAGLGAGAGWEAISAISPKLVPENLHPSVEAGRKVVQEGITKPIKEMINRPASIIEKASGYLQEHPVEAALNVVPFMKAGKVTQAATATQESFQKMKAAAKTATEVSKVKEIEFAIRKGYAGTIHARMEGPKKIKDIDRYMDSAANVTLDQIRNKDKVKFLNKSGEEVTGRVPETIAEMGQVVESGMDRTGKLIGNAIASAEAKGAKSNLSPMVKELRDHAKTVSAQRSGTAKYANDLADFYEGQGPLAISDVQKEITSFNNKSKTATFSPDAASQEEIHRIILKNLRKSEDDTLISVQGEGIKPIKDLYRDYKSVQKDVVNKVKAEMIRGGVPAGQANQLVSKYTLGELAFGLSTGHGLAVAKGTMFGLTNAAINYMTKPDRAIAKMYQKIEGLLGGFQKEQGVLKGVEKAALKTAGPASVIGRESGDEELKAKIRAWLQEGK